MTIHCLTQIRCANVAQMPHFLVKFKEVSISSTLFFDWQIQFGTVLLRFKQSTIYVVWKKYFSWLVSSFFTRVRGILKRTDLFMAFLRASAMYCIHNTRKLLVNYCSSLRKTFSGGRGQISHHGKEREKERIAKTCCKKRTAEKRREVGSDCGACKHLEAVFGRGDFSPC